MQRTRPTNPSSYPPGGSTLYGPPSPVPPQQGLSSASGGQMQFGPQSFTISTGRGVTPTDQDQPPSSVPVRYQLNGMVTGVLVPTENSSGTPTGAQPSNADFVLASGSGADVYGDYGPPSLRGAPGGRPEPAISLRYRDPSPNPVAAAGTGIPGRTYTVSPIPGGVPSHGNRLGDPTPNPDPAQAASRYSRSRDPSPHPGTAMYGPRSQTPSPIPAYQYNNQSRDLPVPIPGTGPAPARDRYPRSRSPSPLPGAGASSSPGAFPTWRNRSRDPSPIPPPAAPSRYANSRAPLEAGAVPAGPGQSKTLRQDAFSRPANFMQPDTSFETRKIQDMDDYYVPMMPKVLVSRNVNHDEWIRFVQELTLAWAGRLSSQSSVVATAGLIDRWNNTFFTPRGVEVILFEGRERRSGGQMIGQTERDLPGFSEDSDSDTPSSDSEYGRGAGVGGSYADSRRMRAESMAEKRRKKKEKARRGRREREKTFALYMKCITPRDGALSTSY